MRDANIQSVSAAVLRGGLGAGLTVFGHSDEAVSFLNRSDIPNEDRAKQKHCGQ
jgi:hypothetical protein